MNSQTAKKFIKSIMDKDYSQAQEHLEDLVDEKLTQSMAAHLESLKENNQ